MGKDRTASACSKNAKAYEPAGPSGAERGVQIAKMSYCYRNSIPSGPWKPAMLSLGSPQLLTQGRLL
jgi:hypothetical protein